MYHIYIYIYIYINKYTYTHCAGNQTALSTASSIGKKFLQSGKYEDAVNVLSKLQRLIPSVEIEYMLSDSLASIGRYGYINTYVYMYI
jgi:hypothetical protein